MDINSFLQALHITAMVVSLAGVITEAMLGKSKGVTDCDNLHWYSVLMCLIPVVNIIVAVCVWAAIIVDDTPPSPPSSHVGCAC